METTTPPPETTEPESRPADAELVALQLAWTFTVASTQNITERMLHIRDETITEGNDSHEDPRADPDVRRQKAAFLFDGEIVDVCEGGPCLADHVG